jgi:hypothetical protein
VKSKRIYVKRYDKSFILRMANNQFYELNKDAIKRQCSIASIIREAIDNRR